MNIVILCGGKGERFSKNGYDQPKPLIKVFDICMIEYVIDNLNISNDDNVFIIYNINLDNYQFCDIVNNKYPFINFIKITDTKGATESLCIGLSNIMKNYKFNEKCLILDCDAFYTNNIMDIFRNSNNNIVYYTKNYESNPIYSYIKLNDDNLIVNIKEKNKISDNANTGAYAFNDIKILYQYCNYILDNNITFNNEPYISCVINEMIKNNIAFYGNELDEKYVFSLGTPLAVNNYIDRTFAFLFDLDGTLVITDDVYFDVWSIILSKYNVILTKDIFKNYIQGNNDKYVLQSLLMNVDITLSNLSKMKDDLFIENIQKIKIIDGVYDIINNIKLNGHKICIVTNCNKTVANAIIKRIKINNLIDFIISSDDCTKGKPDSEPYIKAMKKYNINNKKCYIFEDSKTGILSGLNAKSKLLIGITTIYNDKELLSLGTNLSIKNYQNFNIYDLIDHKLSNENVLINIIKNSSNITNIKDIIIDDKNLKGGFIADVISFKIITNDDEIYSQILKYESTNNNDLSIMANKLELYSREYYFYTNICDKININVPKFYNLTINDNYDYCGFVLENLFEKKYKINLNLNIESIDISLKIIDRMAKMHSKFWNKNLNKLFPKLKNSTSEIFCPFFMNYINDRYDLFKMKWFNILNDMQKNECEYIFNNFQKIQNNFSEGNHLTFIHGDIKSPNIFYDIEKDYEPYFIDWQHCAIGKGVQDLIFFIIESFDITNIKCVFKLLKNYYYKKIIEYGIKNYTLQEYENDIYDAVCYIPFFTSIWFGTISQDDLIDKNFPYFLITKMFYLISIIKKN